MPDIQLSPKQQEARLDIQNKYEQLRAELREIGFILQGSVTERWKKCGKAGCRCSKEPDYRHGPYYQLSWKTGGQTYSVSLSPEQADLAREWIQNNQKVKSIIKQLRRLSLQIAQLYEIAKK